ncbi:hypothetical protein C8R46DRAFT_1268526 [Mycena filopes]|nr:hypothetical protein C8R46DRAFT_1268526 [Mycena filopes]
MVHVIGPLPTEASHHDIIWSAGPRLLGLLFNWGLLGVLTAQVYIYHVSFPKDKAGLKALVYGIYLLDWAQTCSATYDAFQCIIGATVQIFYGWRIWIFSKSKVVFGVICLLALLQLGGGIAASYYLFMNASEATNSNPHLEQMVAVRLIGSAVVDAVISVSMTYYLLRSKAQALGPMTNVMTRLVRLTIETGTVTVMMAILDLVFFLREHNELHQVSGVVLCKIYSNTLLVLFNNRLVERNKGQQVVSDDSVVSEFRVAPSGITTAVDQA